MKLFLLCFFMAAAFSSFAQTDTMAPAYKRYPEVPGLQLLLSDSTKYTNDDLPKKKQVLLMLFSPDCDHCQHEAEQIAANKEALSNTHIVMATTYPLFRLKAFAEKYGLADMPNVVMTKDPYYLLISFYSLRSLPYLSLYDKKRKLIRTYEGSVSIDKVLQAFEEAR
jgi:thiol-disulfide isomerase/thioredoxin